MLFKKPTFYLAVAGTVATIVMVARLNGQSPVKPPPIDPSPKPYAVSVAASGIIEALSENVAIGVPEAGLVTKVHVKVWDSIQEVKGDTTQPIELRFIRIEPYVVPKVSLTGASTERVDTRVLQVIYSFERPRNRPVYVAQQVDLFVKTEIAAVAAKVESTQQFAQVKGNL